MSVGESPEPESSARDSSPSGPGRNRRLRRFIERERSIMGGPRRRGWLIRIDSDRSKPIRGGSSSTPSLAIPPWHVLAAQHLHAHPVTGLNAMAAEELGGGEGLLARELEERDPDGRLAGRGEERVAGR